MPSGEPPSTALSTLQRRLVLAGLATATGAGRDLGVIHWAPEFLPGMGGEEAFGIFCAVLARLCEPTALTPAEQRAALCLSLLGGASGAEPQ
jgi:hypothetical protein